MNRITTSCHITDRSVYRNGSCLFKNKGADLPEFLLSAYQFFQLNYPKFYKMDNLSKLGWIAAEILLQDWDKEKYQAEDTGLTLSNANSSLDTDRKYFETVKEIPSPALFVYTLPNIMIGEICIRHHFKGESAFFISPQFDAGFIELYVNDLLNDNILKTCICGWVDLLGEEYKAVLYLVEKGTGAPEGNGQLPETGKLAFTKENIHKLFQAENG